jgi:hypothetical protein
MLIGAYPAMFIQPSSPQLVGRAEVVWAGLSATFNVALGFAPVAASGMLGVATATAPALITAAIIDNLISNLLARRWFEPEIAANSSRGR